MLVNTGFDDSWSLKTKPQIPGLELLQNRLPARLSARSPLCTLTLPQLSECCGIYFYVLLFRFGFSRQDLSV